MRNDPKPMPNIEYRSCDRTSEEDGVGVLIPADDDRPEAPNLDANKAQEAYAHHTIEVAGGGRWEVGGGRWEVSAPILDANKAQEA